MPALSRPLPALDPRQTQGDVIRLLFLELNEEHRAEEVQLATDKTIKKPMNLWRITSRESCKSDFYCLGLVILEFILINNEVIA